MPQVVRWVLYLALICICFGSCKSKKHVFDTTLNKIEPQKVDSIIQNHQIDFEWYAIKAKLKFQAPDVSESGTSYVRIKKDSIIWMVLKKFSVEGVRMQMNHDSITIINRLEKSATSMTWSDLSDWYGLRLDFYKFQDLLVGNVFYDPETKNEIIADTTTYVVSQRDDFYAYTYEIPFFEERVSRFKMEDIFARILKINFENCSSNEEYCFFREYKVPLKQEEEIYLSLKLSNLELDIPKSIKFEVPDHYNWY